MEQKIMKYKLLISFLAATQLVTAQGKFLLKGKTKEISYGFVFLNYTNAEGKYTHDSAAVDVTGNFSFEGTIQIPTMVSLSYGNVRTVDDLNFVQFFLEPGSIIVRAT